MPASTIFFLVEGRIDVVAKDALSTRLMLPNVLSYAATSADVSVVPCAMARASSRAISANLVVVYPG